MSVRIDCSDPEINVLKIMSNNAKHPSFCRKKETAEERGKASDVRECESEKDGV